MSPANRPADRPSILIVDDQPGMRLGMQRVLAARGFSCDIAVDGDDALLKTKQRSYGLALVDLKMPGVDGFELISRLREIDPSTICIVVSAFATIQSAIRSTRMGAFDFVAKPFEPDELVAVVNRAAEQWALSREADALRTEREAHLLELSAEKSRLRTILQAMGEGLLVVNVNDEVVLDNPATRRLLGVGPSTIRAPIADVLPDPRFVEEVHSFLHGSPDASAVDLEIRMGARAGSGAPADSHMAETKVKVAQPSPPDRYLRATLAPLRSAEGATVGVVVVLADITDEKALERSKTLFVSMVAHEIKAPIAAVEGYLRLIRDGSYKDQPDQIPRVLDRCLERADALLLLVQDLLEINRREGAGQRRRLEPVDLNALVADLVQFHAPTAALRGIRIDVARDPCGPTPIVDRNDIERIVTNLLSNAIKYNKDGGHVDVRVAAHPAGTMVEVRDTGVGMAPADVARLGEEFFRVKDPRTRAVTGTGLGLALVKKIVSSYLGRLEVESVPDQGTTFRVVLPVMGSST